MRKERRARKTVEKIVSEFLLKYFRNSHKNQDAETASQNEDQNQQQQQVTTAPRKDWFSVANSVVPLFITLVTAWVSNFFLHRYRLSILLTLLTVLISLFFTQLVLRKYIWKEKRHNKPMFFVSFGITGASLVAALVLMGLDRPKEPERQSPTTDVGSQGGVATNPTPTPSAFTVRLLNSVMIPVYPQPLIYVYSYSEDITGTSSDRVIAPIGLAINIEVVNNRSVSTKVRRYADDLETGADTWTRIVTLPTTEPHDIYWVTGPNHKSCVKFDFKPNLFDVAALQRTLSPGESLDGWMFFEWPPEFRNNNRLRNVRIRLENSKGEVTEALFNDDKNEPNQGMDLINKGVFGATGQKSKVEDLSSLPLRPYSGK